MLDRNQNPEHGAADGDADAVAGAGNHGALEAQGSTSPLHAEHAQIGKSPDSSFTSDGSDFEDPMHDVNPDRRGHATSYRGDTELLTTLTSKHSG